MSISVLITLTTGTGGNTGPTFNLFSDADGYATAFETGVTKTNLVAGYTSSVVPDGSTIIRCKSVGTCTNYSDFTISGAPVPSPTPTPTPTGTPAGPSYYYYNLTRYTCIGCGNAATGYVGRSSTTLTTNYYYCPVDDTAHTYKVTSSIGGTYYDIDLDGSTPGASCNVSCSN